MTDPSTAGLRPDWESRTQDELQNVIRAGFAGGDDYDLTVREVERRARDGLRQAELAAEDEIRKRENKVGRLALAASAISVVAAIAALARLLLKLT